MTFFSKRSYYRHFRHKSEAESSNFGEDITVGGMLDPGDQIIGGDEIADDSYMHEEQDSERDEEQYEELDDESTHDAVGMSSNSSDDSYDSSSGSTAISASFVDNDSLSQDLESGMHLPCSW